MRNQFGSSIGPSYDSAMPIAKDGMLFMKKLAKCSAATMINTSGEAARNAFLSRAYPASRREYRSASARSVRAVMPGPWLQTPRKTRLISALAPRQTVATYTDSSCVQRQSEIRWQRIGAHGPFSRDYSTNRRSAPYPCRMCRVSRAIRQFSLDSFVKAPQVKHEQIRVDHRKLHTERMRRVIQTRFHFGQNVPQFFLALFAD